MRASGVVAGSYEIESLVGRGGMGSVYRARDLRTRDLVAIKVQLGRGDAQSRRWAREAMLLSNLAGPDIVRYLAHGREPSGELYLVMEWLEGEDLSSRLEREGLSVAQSLGLVRRVAAALARVHAQGIAHRDVKPSNIFLVDQDLERVKLIDLGIARVGGVTGSHTLLGTPGYVAPEQARGDTPVDARADVFALGCVFFECLTGRPAFVADHVMALLAKILLEDAPRASDVRAELPPDLDDLVHRMLAKDPARRPADGAAVVAELDALERLIDLPARALDHRPAVLTKSEQRLVFVVLVGRGDVLADEPAVVRQGTLDEATDIAPELRALARVYGANAAPLADGGAVLVLEGTGPANDQAVHAARCALALRAMTPDASLSIAVGRAGSGDRLPLGDVIDRASEAIRRGRAAAEPVVVVDDALAGLLEARFELETCAGRVAIIAERARVELPRTLLGRQIPCLGRDRPLADLEQLLEECFAERVARAVLVTAPAGMGKSRLLQELLTRVQARPEAPEVWIARGDPMRAGSPFGMVGQVVRSATEAHEGEPIDVRRARIRTRVARHLAEPQRTRVAEFLGELAGSPFPDEGSVRLRAARADASVMRDQLEDAWTGWLGAESAAKPILLVLEDVHWGDLPSLRLIDVALRTMRNRSWLVLALGRPDVHETFPRLWADRRVHEIRLDDLSPRACEALVRAALGEAASAEAVSRLVEQSAGVPLYLEELVRAEASGRGSQVPETVLGMLQARLERLDVETRRVLRAASVFGGSFPRSGVAALCGVGSRVREVLAALEEHELVERQGDGKFPGDAEFVFRHALVRDAAYASLTEDDRALGHRLAGRWLEDKGDPDAVTLAQHFERAHDSAAAVRWFRRAAEQALDGFDLEAAVSRASRGIACGAEGEALGALRLLQSEAHLWRGDLVGAEREALLAMRDLPRGSARWFKAALGLLMQSASLGREDQIERFIRELAESPSTERSGAQTTAFALALRLLAMNGNLAVARLFLDRLRAIDADSPGEPSITAMLPAGQFYWWSFIDWDPWARIKASERCARECELVGDVMNMAMARVHVAWSHARAGAVEDAERLLRDTLELTSARGVVGLVPDFAQVHFGATLGLLGRLDEGRAALNRAIPRLLGAGNWLIGAFARGELAALHLAAGDAAGAEQEARTACDALSRVPLVGLGARVVWANALLALGQTATALEVARAAAATVDGGGCVTEADVRVRVTFADALAQSGDRDGAERELRRAAELILERVERIPDPAWRRRFLRGVPEHADVLQRATPIS